MPKKELATRYNTTSLKQVDWFVKVEINKPFTPEVHGTIVVKPKNMVGISRYIPERQVAWEKIYENSDTVYASEFELKDVNFRGLPEPCYVYNTNIEIHVNKAGNLRKTLDLYIRVRVKTYWYVYEIPYIGGGGGEPPKIYSILPIVKRVIR